MQELVLFFIISFLVTFAIIPRYIEHAKKKGLVGRDMNKPDRPKVAEAGGIIVYFGTIISYLFVVAYYYLYDNYGYTLYILLASLSLTIIAVIGYLDDTGGWKRGFVRWKKPLVTLIAVVPLMPLIIDRMYISILGNSVHLPYLFYPLVLVPVGFIGATNAVNLLGGFNGLEAGMGLVSMATLAYFTLGTPFFPMVVIPMGAMLAFLAFNRYPSKIFPGDTLTYLMGGIFATVAVLGRFQTVTILIMLPYLLEGLIKSREIPYIIKHKKTFKPECFGRVGKDGSLAAPYKEIWSLTHVVMKIMHRFKKRCSENDVTFTLITLQIVWCLIIIAMSL
jgi:UDP-N-acetylglucosamine--dolichyl-phosphate N-acetylglucosaminephosphotransferase